MLFFYDQKRSSSIKLLSTSSSLFVFNIARLQVWLLTMFKPPHCTEKTTKSMSLLICISLPDFIHASFQKVLRLRLRFIDRYRKFTVFLWRQNFRWNFFYTPDQKISHNFFPQKSNQWTFFLANLIVLGYQQHQNRTVCNLFHLGKKFDLTMCKSRWDTPKNTKNTTFFTISVIFKPLPPSPPMQCWPLHIDLSMLTFAAQHAYSTYTYTLICNVFKWNNIVYGGEGGMYWEINISKSVSSIMHRIVGSKGGKVSPWVLKKKK